MIHQNCLTNTLLKVNDYLCLHIYLYRNVNKILFQNIQNQKQPKGPPIGECNKMLFTNQKKELLIYTVIWKISDTLCQVLRHKILYGITVFIPTSRGSKTNH